MSVRIETCLHPQVTPETGYRYGCRCARCRARQVVPLASGCEYPGCDQLRVKRRRTCAEHEPPPSANGHATKRIEVAACLVCRNPWTYYESTVLLKRVEVREVYRRVCPDCRRPVTHAIRRHHLDAGQALRFLTVAACDCCGGPFPSRWGRSEIHVDHDHDCCTGQGSCGRCVRGFVCPSCNREIGQWEAMQRRGRGPQIVAYLAQADRDIDW